MRIQTDEKHVVRDVNTMTLMNTNQMALHRHKKELRESQEMCNLKKEVEELKTMMKLILEKCNGNNL